MPVAHKTGIAGCIPHNFCMTSSLRHTLDFLLYQWLEAETLQQRSRFSDHSRETFDAVLDTSERIAREKYAPFNRLVDLEEPRTETESMVRCAWCCRRPLMKHVAPMRNQAC